MPQVTDVDDQFGTHTPQADRLQNAIHDRGAFRRFKDILGRTPDELDRWFAIVRRTPARPSPRLARRRRIQALTAPTATYTAPHDDTWLSAMATAKARGLQAITSMGRWRHRGADQHHDRYRNSR
jgi:hypothetical protein